MANTVLLRKSSTLGAVPTTAQLQLGELAVNTKDGSLFLKRNNGTDSIVKVWTNSNHGSGSGLDADFLDGLDSTWFQQKLTSGTNIKTINGISVLGSGNITTGGSSSVSQMFYPTAGQTVFTVTGGYTPNNLYVFRNGVKLVNGVDVDISTGTDVTALTFTSLADDVLEVSGFSESVLTSLRYITENVSSNTTVEAGKIYLIRSTCTLTLPVTPGAGDWIKFKNLSGTTTPEIDRNGKKIMGLSENMIIDTELGSVTLCYKDSTDGWVVIT